MWPLKVLKALASSGWRASVPEGVERLGAALVRRAREWRGLSGRRAARAALISGDHSSGGSGGMRGIRCSGRR